jgi:hypothetical protein
MKWTEIEAGKLHAAEQRLRVALGDQADNVVDRINRDEGFVELAAGKIIAISREVIDKRLTSLNPQWLRARKIMGENFFGVEEAVKHFGVNPTGQQLAAFSEIPFSEVVLEELKDTHVLVAVFPLSILEVRGKESKLFYDQSLYTGNWYNKKFFAKERGEVSWQLVRKISVDNSTSKDWQGQQVLLGKDNEVPTAQVMVYTIIGHYLATGERLFEHIYIRTSFLVSGGGLSVGDFDSRGLDIHIYWDDYRSDSLGVSSARKF